MADEKSFREMADEEMVTHAINTTYLWMKSDDAKDVPPEVSISIGILIGHIHKLEREKK